jgi:hypothetical protein
LRHAFTSAHGDFKAIILSRTSSDRRFDFAAVNMVAMKVFGGQNFGTGNRVSRLGCFVGFCAAGVA